MGTEFADYANTMMKKRTPVTLPNGLEVQVKPLSRADGDVLNKWIRKQYMANVSEACEGLNQAARLELQLNALSHAATLTYDFGEGFTILTTTTYGLSRYVYQMIDSPPIKFEEFDAILFPQALMNLDGMECVGRMIDAAYENRLPVSEDEKAKAEALTKWYESRMEAYDKELDEAFGLTPESYEEREMESIVPDGDKKEEEAVGEDKTS